MAANSADLCGIRNPSASPNGPEAATAYENGRQAAEDQGEPIYRQLAADHRDRLVRERGKGRHAFASRRRTIQRVGLPEVRQHRLRRLAEERRAWERRTAARERAVPELAAILFVRVAGKGELG